MSDRTPETGEFSATVRLIAPPELGETMALYANFVQVTFTPLDFTLHFGWYALPALMEPPDAPQIDVEVRPLAKVSVPLNLVRGIVGVLERQIDGWEETFGQPLPDQPTRTQEQAQEPS